MKHSSTDGPMVPGGGHVPEDLCLDLLNGLLDEPTRTSILRHLKSCEMCEARFQELYVDRERGLVRGAVRRRPDGQIVIEERNLFDESPLPARDRWARRLQEFAVSLRRPRTRFAGAFAMAAIAVVLLIRGLPIGPHDSLDLHRLPSRMDDLNFRSAVEQTQSDELAAGLTAYAEGDLNSAVERLLEADVDGVAEIIRTIYLANAQAERKRYREASQLLRNLPLRHIPDPWGREATWTLYVSLRKSGQDASADSLFRLLVDDEGEIGRRARKIE